MPSEKVTRILKSRGMTADQIEVLEENEAWRIVYSTATKKKEPRVEICFTGFTDAEKDGLADQAHRAGMHVVTGVTKALSFLCAGDNAGPSKMAKAQEQNATVLTRDQFRHLLETGELP